MKKQQGGLARLHILAHEAWQAHAYVEELDMSDRKAEEAWRRGMIEQHSGQRSSKGLSKEQFEDIMLEFAITAQNDKEARYWATATDRRYRFQVHHFLKLLAVVRGEVTSWSYVREIMDRMSLPEHLDDMTTDQLQNVIAALDTHFRRLCKEMDMRPVDVRGAINEGDKLEQRTLKRAIEHKQKFAHK